MPFLIQMLLIGLARCSNIRCIQKIQMFVSGYIRIDICKSLRYLNRLSRKLRVIGFLPDLFAQMDRRNKQNPAVRWARNGSSKTVVRPQSPSSIIRYNSRSSFIRATLTVIICTVTKIPTTDTRSPGKKAIA